MAREEFSCRKKRRGREHSERERRNNWESRGRSANETPGRWWRRRCLTFESHQKSSPGTSSFAVSRLDEEVVLSASSIVIFFCFFPGTVNTNSAKIASWTRRGIEAEGGCCCQPWGRVSVCENELVLRHISFQTSRITFGVPRQCTCRSTFQWRSFSHRMEHFGQWFLPCKKFGSIWELIWKNRKFRWVHVVIVRIRGSVISFDMFDPPQLGSAWWIDRFVLLQIILRFRRSSIVETLTRLWPLRESRSRLFASVYRRNWNHSRTRLEYLSLLNSQTFFVVIVYKYRFIAQGFWGSLIILEHNLRISAIQTIAYFLLKRMFILDVTNFAIIGIISDQFTLRLTKSRLVLLIKSIQVSPRRSRWLSTLLIIRTFILPL